MKPLLIIFSMSPKVTEQSPGAYLTNGRFDECFAFFEEQHALDNCSNSSKAPLKKPYLLFRKMSALEEHG